MSSYFLDHFMMPDLYCNEICHEWEECKGAGEIEVVSSRGIEGYARITSTHPRERTFREQFDREEEDRKRRCQPDPWDRHDDEENEHDFDERDEEHERVVAMIKRLMERSNKRALILLDGEHDVRKYWTVEDIGQDFDLVGQHRCDLCATNGTESPTRFVVDAAFDGTHTFDFAKFSSYCKECFLEVAYDLEGNFYPCSLCLNAVAEGIGEIEWLRRRTEKHEVKGKWVNLCGQCAEYNDENKFRVEMTYGNLHFCDDCSRLSDAGVVSEIHPHVYLLCNMSFCAMPSIVRFEIAVSKTSIC
ncbi:MAG: hypothetical protein F4100_03700 [Rhodothermaceae bacterium]|nr:hypothetical protein [Rhodothermaceae bacterium]MYE63391.1 hypothetical protein [Rhodothermaceae bacterium]MYJ19842.1 hypothetical protein [Rhodothermaceae bacterium]